MKQLPTAGLWRGTRLRPSSSDWPFDWVCDVTSFDPDTGIHQYVATIHQSGARRGLEQASANARTMTEAAAMARVIDQVARVLAMSDPEHEEFVDSAADCLDVLLQQGPEIHRIRKALAGPTRSAAAVRH